MSVPKVVIVGRPNVGKSTLFNWLCGRRIAITDNRPGVTRDRVSYLMDEDDRFFELVDTGGMGNQDEDNLTEQVEDQIDTAIEEADVVLFVVDTRAGLTPMDQDVAKRLRYVDKPIVCVANKTDRDVLDLQADEFYKLGRGKLVRVSALANRNRDELMKMILERLPSLIVPDDAEPPPEPEMKVAVVGRRNVGKSTFINTLAQAERMIVSEVPGTTRDSVDVRFEMDGKAFLAIDTPGLTRTKAVKSDLDFYSTHRAQRSIRRADVALLFLDASDRISKVDKQLCNYIAEQYKPCIFVVNKWDLQQGKMPTEKWVLYLRDTFQTMPYTPIAFVTGQTGKNVKALLNHATNLFKQGRARVPTSELNRVIRAAVERNEPPLFRGRRPKFFYGAQVAEQPPTIVLFCSEPSAFSPQYRRYLLSVLREQMPFSEVPIKLYLHERVRDEQGYAK
jgi:GTP-binding protein